MRDFISKLFFVFVNSFSFKWLYSRKRGNSPLRVSLSCSESALLYDTDHTLRLLNCWERAEREANTRFSCVEELRGAILFLLRRGGRTLSAGVVWPLHYRVRLSPALSSHLLLRQPSQRQPVRVRDSQPILMARSRTSSGCERKSPKISGGSFKESGNCCFQQLCLLS